MMLQDISVLSQPDTASVKILAGTIYIGIVRAAVILSKDKKIKTLIILRPKWTEHDGAY